ncbi:hypothetical protein, partial [Flavobacterium sp. UBA6195]|uniref:hypothetical protein n=1 Tax=Flavobacterium sp. UBA6195 TaxID=1946554 RepID=UPI0025C4CAC7
LVFLVVKFYTELHGVSFDVDFVERAAQRALRLYWNADDADLTDLHGFFILWSAKADTDVTGLI